MITTVIIPYVISLNEYKLLHVLPIVKIKQLEAVLFTFLNNTRAKLAMLCKRW